MAQNLLYIMEKEGPGTKFMVWQHNDHISNRPGHKTLGYNLHQMLGNKYMVLALNVMKVHSLHVY